MSRGRLPILAAGGFLVGILLGLVLVPGALQGVLPQSGARTVGHATVGGPFDLVDHNGQRVTDADYRGRFMLVFFGFTHCPDVCPSALQVAAAALDKLGARADRVTPVFITVDPKRDTPAQLKSYVASFHPRLVGLTGSAEQIAKAARAYRVYYKEVADTKSQAGYAVDHSSIIYVMGPDGRFLTHFTHTSSVDAIATGLGKLL